MPDLHFKCPSRLLIFFLELFAMRRPRENKVKAKQNTFELTKKINTKKSFKKLI